MELLRFTFETGGLEEPVTSGGAEGIGVGAVTAMSGGTGDVLADLKSKLFSDMLDRRLDELLVL